MSMTNEVAALMNDSLTNKVALFNENASKYTDQAVRDAFFEILGEEKLTWKGWRRHKIECFEIMEIQMNLLWRMHLYCSLLSWQVTIGVLIGRKYRVIDPSVYR